MLYLQLHLNEDRYVVDTTHVVTVTPLLKLHKIPRTPDYIAGLVNYHGRSVPVIDMNSLICNETCKHRLSTRIILIDVSARRKMDKAIGLLAEKITEVIKLEQNQFVDSGVYNPSAPYLGRIASDGDGLLQIIEVNYILDKDLEKLLFQ